jgi:SAM-dependent methyltransferase
VKARRDGPSEAALRRGTEAHYEDPSLYDRTYSKRREDVLFYVELARGVPGPILEVGAGSGRVTLALARAGHEVVAVDRMEPMLARLRDRLAKEPRAVRGRVEIVRGDVLSLRLRRRFALAMAPFNVFMHLYHRPEIERGLATCRAHLAPRGRLAFDVLMPDLRALLRDPGRVYPSRPVRDGAGKRWRYAEQFEYDAATQIQIVTAILTAEDDPNDVRVVPLAHRQFFPAELEAHLAHAGFTIEERFGDFDRSPQRVTSDAQVIVARRR